MADYCQQCSIENFGEDSEDLKGLNKSNHPLAYVSVLCEGCGPTIVDREGKCVGVDCLLNHNKKAPEKKPSYKKPDKKGGTEMSLTLSDTSLLRQFCDEAINTLFYDDAGNPLRSMTLKHNAFKKQVKSPHVEVYFPGVGTFLIAIKKIKEGG